MRPFVYNFQQLTGLSQVYGVDMGDLRCIWISRTYALGYTSRLRRHRIPLLVVLEQNKRPAPGAHCDGWLAIVCVGNETGMIAVSTLFGISGGNTRSDT